ncbi:uncharacterized protein LOC135073874 [Ostrinia nubilalis]|uniref:uncharacterized protein LOC135073874 n=1 Tax=Ostrinia nubilalis TaxID=29057 RepID=UPI0030824B6B
MEHINVIPSEMLNLIPKFEGDGKTLNLFLRECQYVINIYRGPDENVTQNSYVFHAITSRLVGRAAALLSEREDINTWIALKQVLTQHFGDPRSEACIAIELEQIKIKHGESYSELCHRIQNVKSTLMSKVNMIEDEGIKAAKVIIYDNTALNVFLFNLTEDMIRVIRLRGCTTLEQALSIVTEEENFQFQYNMKNKNKGVTPTPSKPSFTQSQPAFKPNFVSPTQAFKFGIPFNNNNPFKQNFTPFNRFNPNGQNFRYNMPQNPNNMSNQPKFVFSNQNPQNFRFQPNQNPRPIYRMPSNNNNHYRPNPYSVPMNRFNQFPQQNNQFKFGLSNPPLAQRPSYKLDTDVSMRSAAPIHHNLINNPETPETLFYEPEPESPEDQYYYYYDDQYEDVPQYESEQIVEPETHNDENFQIEASPDINRK